MKKIVISILITAVLMGSLAFLPKVYVNSALPVEITSITLTEYSKDIHTTGVVEEISKKDVIAKLPIVTEKVYYQIGDIVEANDVIADIDVDATVAAIIGIAESAKIIPEEYKSVIAKIDVSTDIISDNIPTTILAPMSGTITEHSLINGSICTPNSSVLTISKQDEKRIRFSVNENDIYNVKNGDTVVFKANATGDKKYTGTVDLIFPTATKTIVGTSQSTVVNLYVTPTEQYEHLIPGYSITGVIKSPITTEVYTLPYECIKQNSSNEEFVYIVNGNKVQQCEVKTGLELPEGVEIVSPNLSSQKIVTDPNLISNEDVIVKITN